ncbi:hypothetical protein BDV29DRAFT_192821 [Aspergillus leporis]|uniref:BZIP domain-containing protein n=1 Tax=Aspergillus leporis TaxID=41062 RepID=A0A5N5WU54_9EURO|nr:hypothetical protein BDV29DRAFT_192821 [Aspergillus leporis]
MKNKQHEAGEVDKRGGQRRSRARRKEYIQVLEQRLHKFETLDVQATREAQVAGRKAAVENTHLRSLLRLHGVFDQDVQEYLRAHTANIVHSIFHSGAGSSQLSSFNCECKNPLYKMANTEPNSSLSSPPINQQVTISKNQISDGEQRVPVDSPTHGQSTPCETAAKINTSMRNNYDARSRSELGCHSNSNCMVRNMDIFQLLDE